MRRDPLREQRITEDPAGEGARALEPVLEWYAAYKHFWRTHPIFPRRMPPPLGVGRKAWRWFLS
jgi:hypothetical protein